MTDLRVIEGGQSHARARLVADNTLDNAADALLLKPRFDTITIAASADGTHVFHNASKITFDQALFLLSVMEAHLSRLKADAETQQRPRPICAETDGDCA